MCIIAICSRGHFLGNQEITNCFNSNPDGVGMGWSDGSKVHIKKGFMTLESFLNYYCDEFQVQCQDAFIPHVIHFRTATSGDISREMTHPFVMSTASELIVDGLVDNSVLFHNGVMSDWKALLVNMVTSGQIPAMPKGPMNDTRVAAIMASLPNVGDEVLEVLSGKFVKIQPDGTIIRWGHFELDKNVQYSNNAYKWPSYRYKHSTVKNTCLLGNENNESGDYFRQFSGKQLNDLTDEEWSEYLDERYPSRRKNKKNIGLT